MLVLSPVTSFEKEVEKIDFVFVGKVIEVIEDANYVSPEADETKKFFIKIRVEKNFKGVKESEITLIQYKYKKDMPCGSFIQFEKRKKYLISANKNKDNKIEVDSFCSRTQRFDKNSDRYKQLIKLKKQNPIYKEAII